MRLLILCHERLNRVLLVLARQGGSETLRQIERRFGVWCWEVEQTASLGLLEIEPRKPAHAARLRSAESAKRSPQNSRLGAVRLRKKSASGTGGLLCAPFNV
jgi:hypothetical protein